MTDYPLSTQTKNPDRFSVPQVIARRHNLRNGDCIWVTPPDDCSQRCRVTSGLEVILPCGTCQSPRTPITICIP